MFKIDQPKIAEWAWESEENLIDVMLFVRVTIRRHFFLVPQVMETWRQDGVQALRRPQDRDALPSIQHVVHIIRRDMSPREALLTCLRIKGIGIVKAGFIVQLLYGEVGCLDRHNMEWFHVKPRQFSMDSHTSFQTVQRKVDLYIAVCKAIGTAEFLWDHWCTAMATEKPHIYKNGGFVSFMHVKAIMGRVK